MKTNEHAGQHDLRGKKTKDLSCRCCSMSNKKEDYMKQVHLKEIRSVILAKAL